MTDRHWWYDTPPKSDDRVVLQRADGSLEIRGYPARDVVSIIEAFAAVGDDEDEEDTGTNAVHFMASDELAEWVKNSKLYNRYATANIDDVL